MNIDLSEHFFRTVTGRDDLALGVFGVGNFFFSTEAEHCAFCTSLIEEQLVNHMLDIVAWRQVPVNEQALNAASNAAQQTIHQVIFVPKKSETEAALSARINDCLIDIEAIGFNDERCTGFFIHSV